LSDGRTTGALANGFVEIYRELARRTKRPSGQFVYWAHFVMCVVLLGGLALWIELIQQNHLPQSQRDWNNTYTSLVTIFPALIGSSSVQMVFEAGNRRVHAFSLIMCFVALITGAALISAPRPADTATWVWAIAMTVFSLWIWWIANADNTRLHDEPPGDAPLGGDPEAPLGGAGDFGGVRV
jgi:O-antigen/teichoic acid export membrane protein